MVTVSHVRSETTQNNVQEVHQTDSNILDGVEISECRVALLKNRIETAMQELPSGAAVFLVSHGAIVRYISIALFGQLYGKAFTGSFTAFSYNDENGQWGAVYDTWKKSEYVGKECPSDETNKSK